MGVAVDAVKVGDWRELTLIDDLTRTQIVQYAGASGDFNPLHSDELFAKEVAGYPGVFAHGMLTMGATGRILTDWMGDDRLLTYGVRFVKQVWPGDTLTARAEITAISARDGLPLAELSVITSNQDGTSVLVGTAVARLDG